VFYLKRRSGKVKDFGRAMPEDVQKRPGAVTRQGS
jgi:hypothetical protein